MIEVMVGALAALATVGLGVGWTMWRRWRAADALARQFKELFLGAEAKLKLQAVGMLRLGQQYRQEMERGDKLAAANETLRAQIRQLRQPQEQTARMLPRWRFSRN